MTINNSPILKPEELRDALSNARDLINGINPKWLEKQKEKRSNDPVLIAPNKAMHTRKQNVNAIANDYQTKSMHNIAECIFSAQRSLDEKENGLPTLTSQSFHLVLSLSDIFNHKDEILGINDRLHKLFTVEWKTVIYEALIAISYLPKVKVEIRPDSAGGPDIKLYTTPPVYVECKTRLKIEEKVKQFVRNWRRFALQKIFHICTRYYGSYLIKVVLKSPPTQKFLTSSIPNVIEKMIKTGKIKKTIQNKGRIVIEPWSPEREKLPKPVPALSEELIKIAFDFDDFDNWHYVFTEGEYSYLSEDERFVTGVGKRSLICVRADYLKNSTAPIENAVKQALRKQFKDYRPGILFIHLNSCLYGIGRYRDPIQIANQLNKKLPRIIKDYTRILQIVVDISTQKNGLAFPLSTQRYIFPNNSTKLPNDYNNPKPILF